MENGKFAGLCADIDLELKNLERLVKELKTALLKINGTPDSFEIRAIGSILHDFYTGTEKIFENIAIKVDRDILSADGWHIQLLKRMEAEVPNVRPSVIDYDLGEILSELLSFRHLFRNIYGFELRWERCKDLADKLEGIFEKLRSQLLDFKTFLFSLG